jgi:hypothetical protein
MWWNSPRPAVRRTPGHEVEELEREEERHHEAPPRCREALREDSVHERGIDADVQDPERLVLAERIGKRHHVERAHRVDSSGRSGSFTRVKTLGLVT